MPAAHYICAMCQYGERFHPEDCSTYTIEAYTPEEAACRAVVRDATQSAESPSSYIDRVVAVQAEHDVNWLFFKVTEVEYEPHVYVTATKAPEEVP